MNKLPSQRVLCRLLSLDPHCAHIFWRPRPTWMFGGRHGVANSWNGKFAGQRAFTAQDSYGYFKGEVLGIKTSAHRVIWKMVYGTDPNFIDHIDGNTANNKLNNLRSVTHQENCRNSKQRSDNTSGCTGVSWTARDKKWRAYIMGPYGVVSLGYFKTKPEALAARKAGAALLNYGPSHGRTS